MIILLLALLIGVVAGFRSFTAPATISRAADTVAILAATVTVMVPR